MNQKKEEKKANLKIRVGVLICVIALMLFFVSYGYFYVSSNQSDRNRLTGGCFNPTFTDGSSISLTNAVPMTNEEGLKSTPYDFTLTNSCQTNVKYYVILNIKDGSMDPKNISVSYDGQTSFRLDTLGINTNETGKSAGYTTSYVLKQDMLNNGSKTEHIRLWLNDEADYNELQSGSNTFTAEVKVVEGVGSFTGADKILSLVKGADTSSTDVIDKGTIGTGSTACTNTLAYDGTNDNNLRYVGANPCNYVTFNGETAGWRIVGIMNNVDDGTGNLETRIKLMRKDLLGSYSWDTSVSGENGATSNYGINDWTQADLKNELNGDYLDTTLGANTNWYNGSSNAQTGVYDYTKGLSQTAQAQIGNAKWYLGGLDNTEAEKIPSTMYSLERGTKVWGSTSGQTCNDGACPRATEWTGKVALIYPSDYGYATAGGTTTNRSTCIGTLSTYSNSSGETWYNSSYSDCKKYDWLKPSSGYYWLLSPYSNGANFAFNIGNAGAIYSNGSSYSYAVRPAVYLESSVTISGGNGTQSEPYVLE